MVAHAIERFIMANSFDSRADILEHILEVRANLDTFVTEMLKRGSVHDASKFDPEEKPAFDEAIPLLRGISYGSPEYVEVLDRLAPAFDHHYQCNSHHPEHYGAQGIAGMDLFDLVEMICDWMAAAKRNPEEGVKLAYNVELFGIDEQLASILANTLARWPERRPH
jgi:Family of unknown function (DUF5662)